MSPDALPAVETVDILALAQVRRVAAMLDFEPASLRAGDPLPNGWHFAMLAGETPRHALRSDGFPGLGVAMPQMDRARLLLGQRITAFHKQLLIGAAIARSSRIESITEKTGRSGPLSIVRIEHTFTTADAQAEPALAETQTYYLAGLTADRQETPKPAPADIAATALRSVVTPDDILLFQYSALGFNTHRIHFDRDYATRIEGHPDLVVNGGLATLLATEYLRTGLGRQLKTLSARHLAPLYVNRPMTIVTADLTESGAALSLLDDDGIAAAELVVTFHGL